MLKTLSYKQALSVWKSKELRMHFSEGLEKEEYLVDLGHRKRRVRKKRASRLRRLSHVS